MRVMRGSILAPDMDSFFPCLRLKFDVGGKLILVQGLGIFTRMLSPAVKKREGDRNELTEWLKGLCLFCVG